MIQFILFGMYLCFGTMVLVVWPILAMPVLPVKRKLVLITVAFFVIVPLGLGLYAWLGTPQLAAMR